jgi:hypothetical protein
VTLYQHWGSECTCLLSTVFRFGHRLRGLDPWLSSGVRNQMLLLRWAQFSIQTQALSEAEREREREIERDPRHFRFINKKLLEELTACFPFTAYFTRHGPHKRHHVQQFFHCCVCILCRLSLPSRNKLDRQTVRWSHRLFFVFPKWRI